MTDHGPVTACDLKIPKPKVIRHVLHLFSSASEEKTEIPISMDYPHNTCSNLIQLCVNFV